MTYLIIILILLVIVLLFVGVKKVVVYRSEKGRVKEEKKAKILEALRGARGKTPRQAQGKITNDEVQKLLGISDATATRYLDELEKEGKVRQVGQRGRGVFYEII